MHFKNKLLTFFLLLVTGLSSGLPLETKEDSMPLKLDTGNPAPYGLPSITITIQGKTLPILFDTGAKKYGLALTKEALKNIQVHFTGNKICSLSTDGQHCEDEFIIPEVHVGHFTVKNVKGALLTKLWGGNDANFKESEASKNGLIGYQLLSQFNILLDYPHTKVTFFRPNTQPAIDIKNWPSTPFTGHLLTQLYFSGKPILLSWDTGAIPVSVIKPSYAVGFITQPCPITSPYNKNCISTKSTPLTTSKGEKLADTWFKLESKLPSKAPFDGLVGSIFYIRNLVYFDFDHHMIYVMPATLNKISSEKEKV